MADDAMFMGQWSAKNIDTIIYVLKCFQRASGLHINLTKSKLMGLAVSEDRVEQAATRIGCGVLKAPFAYQVRPYDEEGDPSNVEGNRRVASDDCDITVEDEAATIATQIGENVTYEGNVHNNQNGEDPTNVLETSPVLRRSSRQRNLPSKLNDFVVGSNVKYGLEKYVCYSKLSGTNFCFSTTLNKSFEPKTYLEASQNPKWVEAMNLEMEALHRNNTYVLADLPPGRKAIWCKWI
ncbi:ribonuclease H-like domain-containing protein [Tanacetum coccineum]